MTKGYNSYRGRTSGGMKVAILVMVLLLLASCAYLLRDRYLEYDSDGGIHFRLPWSDSTPETTPQSTGGDAQETGDGDPVDLVVEKPKDPLKEVNAVEITDPGRRYNHGALEDAWTEAEGYNAVSLWMKTADGTLGYAIPGADAAAVAENAPGTAVLEKLLSSDTYAIARVSCFHDSAYAMADMTGAGLCQSSGYIWYDNRNTHWLDPGKPGARSYVVSLCKGLAELGFEEILLDEMQYPTAGKISKISYTGERTANIAAFLTELQDALAGTDVKIGVVLDEATVLSGGNDTAGIDLAAVLQTVNRVYVQTADGAAVTNAIHALNKDISVVIIGAETGNRYTVN